MIGRIVLKLLLPLVLSATTRFNERIAKWQREGEKGGGLVKELMGMAEEVRAGSLEQVWKCMHEGADH